MKKLSVLLIITLFVFAGCDWFQAPVDDVLIEDPVVEDPVVEEPVVEEEPIVADTPEDAAADSESKEVVLAKCLTENGVKLYTASWCGHCKKQKEAFKDGLEFLDNIECAEGDEWAQPCKDADVTSVPTWIFADGTKQSGNTPLKELATMGGCMY